MKQITVATYNILHGHEVAMDFRRLARVILEAEADIVGLQEVDMYTNRVGGVDSVGELSRACGMPYSLFVPAMDFDGGRYGTAILSRYPLEPLDVRELYAAEYEPRSLGVVRITLPDGESLIFANTHLSYEDPKTRLIQLKQISFRLLHQISEAAPHTPVILTGDFNTENFQDFRVLVEAGFALVNCGDEPYKTFRTQPMAIDNVVYRAASITPVEHGMIEGNTSDHNLLWCRFEMI